MLPRTVEWFSRASFSAVAMGGLGWGAEYWDADPTHYEDWEALRDRHVALGHKRPPKWKLAAELSEHLLDDVLVAAGGVERAIVSLRSVVAELQQYCDEHVDPATHGANGGLGQPAATEAWYEFANLVVWTRTLDERLDREARDRKLRRQGLLPALKPRRLTRRVTALVDELRDGPVGETRLWSNFILHQALVRHPFSGAGVDASGTVRLPIPDAPSGRVAHWYLLTWNQGRDGITYAEELWRAVEEFIDGLLTAFEGAIPKRLRRTATPPPDP